MRPRSVPKSVKRAWWRAVGGQLLLLLAMGVATVMLTNLTTQRYEEAKTHFDGAAGPLFTTYDEMQAAERVLGTVLYELDGDVGLDEAWARVLTHDARIRGLLATLAADLHHGAAASSVERLEADWDDVMVGAAAARARWGTEYAKTSLAAGTDPYDDTVWAPLKDAYGTIVALGGQVVDELGVGTDEATNSTRSLQVIVMLGAALGAGLMVLSMWHLSRRLLAPLVQLQQGAVRLRDGDLWTQIEVDPRAALEATVLAGSLNDMAAALRESHERLSEQATTDELTGLLNRRGFNRRLEGAIASATPGSLAMLLLDLDDFKLVNDSIGHVAGDEVLAIAGSRLRSAARTGDVVARLGGDEFAILVEGADALATAASVAHRVLERFAAPLDVQNRTVTVRCSIGTAALGPDAGCAEKLLRNADIAMYEAKAAGKRGFATFDVAAHSAVVDHAELHTDLRHAVRRGELELEYQPVVELDTGEVLGFEALLRWEHPRRGRVMPGEFVALAESTGDIVEIGDWVVDQACEDLARLRSLVPPGHRGLSMAVNVSARQLLTPGFVARTRAALERHGVPAEALVVELTERALLEAGAGRAALAQLRGDGIRVAVDDFGTGFSSLRYLHELPIDCLKIDRSFLAASDESHSAGAVLSTIVSLARLLGLDLVAEGIEHDADRERLRRLGPMAGQGYLLGRPMPLSKASERLLAPASAAAGTDPAGSGAARGAVSLAATR